MQKPTSHDRNFRRLRLQKQSLTTPPLGCRVHHAAPAMRHWELAATHWTEFESNIQSATSPGESSARLPAGLRPHRHPWCHRQSTCSAQKRTVGIKGRQSVAALLASDFCKSDHLQLSVSHFGPCNVAKCLLSNKQPWRWPLRFEEKKHGVTANWPNIATKFARRGTQRILPLSNWSSWHPAASATQWTEFDRKNQSSTSPRESCAGLPADLRPHQHPWCYRQSTCSAQKRTVGIKGRQSVAALLASDFCKSDHLQLSVSHFGPCNVAKCLLSNKQPWRWPWHSNKNTASKELAKQRNQVLQDEAPREFRFSQICPAGAAQLLPCSGRNLIATKKVQLLQGRVPQDFQQVCGPIGTGVIVKTPVIKRGLWGCTAPAGGWHIEKGTFMPSKPQSSKNLAFVGGRPYYHLGGATCKIYHKPQKILAW